MSKRSVGLILVIMVCLATTITVAQSIFSSAPAAAPAPAAGSAAPVMSPDDFKSHVNDLNKQNQAAMDAQMKEALSKNPPPPLPSASNGGMAGAPYQAPQQAQQQQAPASTNISQAPAGNAGSQQAPAQAYTGFQDNSGNSSAPPPQSGSNTAPAASGGSNSQSGGGWNIKY